MTSREHSFITSNGSPIGLQSAQELAQDSKAALVILDCVLKRRNEALEQQIKVQERENVTLSQDKVKIEQILQDERHNFANKREQLWARINELQMALARKNEDEEQLQRSLSAMKRQYEGQQQRVDQLERQIHDEQSRCTDVVNRLLMKVREGGAARDQLQHNVEQLEKKMQEQNKAYEQAQRELKQLVTNNRSVGSILSSSLETAMPHLRNLLEAYEREQGAVNVQGNIAQDMKKSTDMIGEASNSDLTQRLQELQSEFDRERAQLLEQASDAAKTQQDISRKNLAEREAILMCPISLELLENPVVTECCGKTFSSEGLNQALLRSAVCPFCRARSVVFHANRDVAKLVELHRVERSILGLSEATVVAVRLNGQDADRKGSQTKREMKQNWRGKGKK